MTRPGNGTTGAGALIVGRTTPRSPRPCDIRARRARMSQEARYARAVGRFMRECGEDLPPESVIGRDFIQEGERLERLAEELRGP